MRLLAWLQLAILALLLAAFVVVLVFDPSDGSPRATYVWLIVGMGGLFALVYALNAAGHYFVSASLTVACSMVGPWASVAADPQVARGDLMPLVYVTIPVLLSSLLLPTAATGGVAAVQLAGLGLLMWRQSLAPEANWASLLTYVLIASFLSLVASFLGRRDMRQIDDQTRRLALSEAALREESIHDHLTGLFNRRYLEATLEREVERAGRQQSTIGFIMADVDHFKRLNDAHGHAAGDAVLQALGSMLGAHVRRSDIVCRYGGEEFILILPDASLEATRDRAERVRREVAELRVEHQDGVLSHMTMSLGVAVFPAHGSSGDAALQAADDALYRAKREGRDRVAVAVAAPSA